MWRSRFTERWQPINPEREAEWIARDEERVRQRAASAVSEARGRLLLQIGTRYAACTLENYSIYDPKQKPVMALVRYTYDHLAQHVAAGYNVVMSGLWGTGKDHLTAALLFRAIECRLTVRYLMAEEIWATMRDRIDERASERAFINELSAPDVLAISDPVPPVGPLTVGQMRSLHQIVDKRYRNGRSTWITCNAESEADAASRIGCGAMSRLTEDGSLRCEFSWGSFRNRKRQSKGHDHENRSS